MDAFLPKPVSVDALARALARWIPDLAAGGAASSEPAGALFDPEALRSLFGVGARLAGMVQRFADSAARDVAALGEAQDAARLAACAHRLKGGGADGGRAPDRRASDARRSGCEGRRPRGRAARRPTEWRCCWPIRCA